MDVFENEVVLFERSGEESQRVGCGVTAQGELVIERRTTGIDTQLALGCESCAIELSVDRLGTRKLMEYFHVEEVGMLPSVLRLEYAGIDCLDRVRSLLDRLEIAYDEVERVLA